MQASSQKETPPQKFSCWFFQIFKNHVSLQNNSRWLLLQIQYWDLRFKSYSNRNSLLKNAFLLEAVVWRCSVKKMFLEILQNSQENTRARFSFLIKLQTKAKACNFVKKETLAQVFSCEFCEISKNNFPYKTPLVTASALRLLGFFLFFVDIHRKTATWTQEQLRISFHCITHLKVATSPLG